MVPMGAGPVELRAQRRQRKGKGIRSGRRKFLLNWIVSIFLDYVLCERFLPHASDSDISEPVDILAHNI